MTVDIAPRDLSARLAAADKQLSAGNFDNAIALLRSLQADAPGDPVVLRCLGIAHAIQGQNELAIPLLVQSVNISCNWETASALLRVLSAAGCWADITNFGEAAKNIFQDNPLFLNTWGLSLIYTGKYDVAASVLERAMALAPGQRTISHNLADALNRLGRKEEAVEAFSKSTSPWNRDTPPPAPATLRQAYARLSADYDSNALHQSFPQRVVHYLTQHSPDHPLGRVLELGCGTGALAARLPPGVTHLAGIDQSPEMLAKARARGEYDDLMEGDMVAVMATLTGPVDTVIAACVLYHIADLAPVFAQVARLLGPGGVFTLSTDPVHDQCDIGETVPGEYCHSRAYLRRTAQICGLTEIAMDIDVHRGAPGFWCSFAKPGEEA